MHVSVCKIGRTNTFLLISYYPACQRCYCGGGGEEGGGSCRTEAGEDISPVSNRGTKQAINWATVAVRACSTRRTTL